MPDRLKILEEITPIAKAVIGAIAGFFSGWFVFRNKKQPEDRVDFQVLLNDYKQQVEGLRREVKALTSQVAELTADRDRFKTQLVLLQAAHYDDPFPRWTKDTELRMIQVSKSYEDMFLKPMGFSASDYIGFNDEVIWGELTADRFRQHDEYVMRTGDTWIGFESHVVGDEDILKNWYFMKRPLYVKGTKTFIGVEGTAIPMPEELGKLLKRKKRT